MAEPADELICPICHGEFQDAVIIQCHHSFCRQCITRWIVYNNENRYTHSKTYKCPVCKSVNEKGKLQKSFYVEQLREMRNRTIRKPKVSPYPECPNHPNEDLKFYCCDCQEFVCVDCIRINRHANHHFEDVSDVAAEMRAKMELILRNEGQKISEAHGKVGELEKFISYIKRQEEIATKNCFTRVDDLKEQIAILARGTVHDIEQRVKDELRTPMDKLRCMTDKLDKTKQYYHDVCELSEARNDFQIITNYCKMLSLRQQSSDVDATDLSLSKYEVDHRTLYEMSDLKLTDLLDADLIIGRVPPEAGSTEKRLEIRNSSDSYSRSDSRFLVNLDDSKRGGRYIRRNQGSSGGTRPKTSERNFNTHFNTRLFNEEHSSPSQRSTIRSREPTLLRRSSSMMDLRSSSTSVKDTLKRLIPKVFKKREDNYF